MRNLIVSIISVLVCVLVFFLTRERQRPNQTAEALPDGQLPQMNADPVQEAHFHERYRAAISFYGQVVDQLGSPIPDAEISFIANDTPWGDGKNYEARADSSGGFSLSGVKGRSLFVAVKKSGYDGALKINGKLASQKSFDYGGNSGDGIHQPDENHPVVFVLRKPGIVEPLLMRSEFSIVLPNDGGFKTVSLYPDRDSSHAIRLSCVSGFDPVKPGTPYDWWFEINVPDGELYERTDEALFTAPEDGYQKTDRVLMDKSQTGWTDRFSKSYFVKFDDGRHARVSFRTYLRDENLVVFESWLNPKVNSPHLEVAPR